MTLCPAHLYDPTGLPCTNEDPHEPGHGCVFKSGSGIPHAQKEE